MPLRPTRNSEFQTRNQRKRHAALVLPQARWVLEARLRWLARGVLVRSPGIAPGLAPWRGAILLLNHNREEVESLGLRVERVGSQHSTYISQPKRRAGNACAPPALAISTKNKHLLVVYATPARGFTAAVSVFKGTPLAKPLDCKIWLERSGGVSGRPWAHHLGGEL